VAGPQGMGIVQTQVPRARRRGDFEYIIFEHRPSRKLVFVLDERADKAKAKPPPVPAAPPDANQLPSAGVGALAEPPPPPKPLAGTGAAAA